MTRSARTVLTLVTFLVCAAGVAIGVAELPNPGTAPVAVAAHAAAALEPTAVDTGGAQLALAPADEAFLADLFDGAATDVDPVQAADLIAVAHRVCDLGQPRADWMASLTVPGPHAFTVGEAGKLLDAAHATYCPAGV